MATEQDHVWAMLDDMQVFLAKRHVPTPERTYKLDGGWTLAMDDLRNFIDRLIAERDALKQQLAAAVERAERAERERDALRAKAETYDELKDGLPPDWPCQYGETGVSILDDVNDLIASHSALSRQNAALRAALEKIRDRAKPLGLDRGDSVTELIAEQALALTPPAALAEAETVAASPVEYAIREFGFNRYVDGRLRAEGVVVHAANLEQAAVKASRMIGPRGTVLFPREENTCEK